MKPSIIFAILLLSAVSCARYLERGLQSPVVEGQTVSFFFRAPSARCVQVAGDWNNWAMGDAGSGEVLVGLMGRGKKGGPWKLAVELPPGRYRYYFIIDETRRVLDPANPRVTDDPRGGKANLLILP